MNSRAHRVVGWLLRYPIPLLIGAIFVMPLLWVLSTSLRVSGAPPPTLVEWIPDPANWSNYQRIFEIAPLARFGLNSFAVLIVAIPVTLLTASWAGFAMAQLRERTRQRLLLLTIILAMVPGSAMWLGRLLLYRYLGVIDTLWTLMFPALMGTTPFFILIYYWAFRRLSPDLFESARLDGATALQVWRRIGMPLVSPATGAVTILTFALYWSEYTGPLIFLRREETQTLSVGLRMFSELGSTGWPFAMAVSILMILPIIILVLIAQRYLWNRKSWLGRRNW